MSGLFKAPKIPKPQPVATQQDAALSAMDEAQRLRKRHGRSFNMLFGGKRRGGQLGSAAGLLGSGGGGDMGSPGGGGGGGSGGGGIGGGGGDGRPQSPSF